MSAPLQHQTVLLEEAIDALLLRADGVYVDATFGRGGHSRLLLSRLGPRGRLLAIDRDPQAIAAAAAINDPRFSIDYAPFSDFAEVLAHHGVTALDGVLMDIGVSSPQIDEMSRGFSFRGDAPLDMRMDPGKGETAAEWLARASESDIREVIKKYGEERFAQQIAKAIVATRVDSPVTTTRQLATLVADCVRTREPGQDPATRTFQALRIHINQELEELALILPRALAALKPEGRLVVISFHSLEDRIAKRFMVSEAKPEGPPPGVPLRASELPKPRLRLVGKPVRPSAEEIAANPRARSAIMRVAEKCA